MIAERQCILRPVASRRREDSIREHLDWKVKPATEVDAFGMHGRDVAKYLGARYITSTIQSSAATRTETTNARLLRPPKKLNVRTPK